MKYKIENGFVVFECNCRFKIIGPPLFPNSDFPAIKFNPDTYYADHDINFNCEATWDSFATGTTKGYFQLEKGAGKKWTKELKPRNMEHLSALGAILRPGTANSYDDKGVSMTEHYCRRKNGEEELTCFHPALEPALSSTYFIMIYQEQAMRIARDIAGFSEQDADVLRKAIGKKLAEEMAKVKIMFLEGCKKVGLVTIAEAEQIFDWIEKGQKYSFNRSHSVGYAILGYLSAFTKTHFPVMFYTSYLCGSQKEDGKGKDFEEIQELVDDTRYYDIDVLPPDITIKENNFYTDGREIFFGLADIKGVGTKVLPEIQGMLVESGIDLETVDWFTFLRKILNKLSTTIAHRLIETGALRRFDLPRQRMIAEYDILHSKLTDGEKEWILANPATDLLSSLRNCAKTKKDGGGCHTEKSVTSVLDLIKSLENPPSPLEDTSDWIAWCEQEYLGISLTCNEVDKYTGGATHTCKDIMRGWKGYAVLCVKLRRVAVYKVKKGDSAGKDMAFLIGADDTCTLESIVVFAEQWEKYSHLLSEDNIVYLSGRLSKKSSFQVEKVYPV